MLPTIAQLEIDQPSESTSSIVHKTFAWDFEENDFIRVDGKLIEVTGIEYVKIWIKKALYTIRDTLIYKDTGYGSEHYTLIGRTFNLAFSKSEYERMIRKALLENDAITSVSGFEFSQSGSRLLVSFNVQSIYGTTGGEVTI